MDTLDQYKTLCTSMLDMGQHLANIDTTPRERDIIQFKVKAYAFRKELTDFIRYIDKDIRQQVIKNRKYKTNESLKAPTDVAADNSNDDSTNDEE